MDRTKVYFSNSTKWMYLPCNENAKKISDFLEVDIFTARILARNNSVQESEFFYKFDDQDVFNFLNIKDIQKAAYRFIKACTQKECIGILCDYDVDGLTSCAQIVSYIRSIGGVEPFVVIPNRLTEGYGPSHEHMKIFNDHAIKCVIMLDCGTSSNDVICQFAHIDVIVIDHHTIGNSHPQCYAFVNPKREDDHSDADELCTSGLSFLFINCVRSVCKKESICIPHVVIKNYLDLVALGSLADCVPLNKTNYILTKIGLMIMGQRRRCGLNSLIGMVVPSRYKNRISSDDVYFYIAPCLNAAGRMYLADVAYHLLVEEDQCKADKYAAQLRDLNEDRKKAQNIIIDECVRMISEYALDKKDEVLFLYSKDWSIGILGIVASKISVKYKRPCIIGQIRDGTITASGRSFPPFSLAKMIHAAKENGLLIKGGGHDMAVGFSLSQEKEKSFRSFLREYMKEYAQNYLQNVSYQEGKIDACVPLSFINNETLDLIYRLEPYGHTFNKPVFLFENLIILDVYFSKSCHAFITLFSKKNCISKKTFYFNVDKSTIEMIDSFFQSGIPVSAVGHIGEYKNEALLSIIDLFSYLE